MIPIQVIANVFAGGLLLATFLMMGKIRLIPMLRYFAIASFCLAGLGATMGIIRGEDEFYIAPIATILFKVIFIPFIIQMTAKKLPATSQLKMYLRPATTYVLFAVVMVISWIIVQGLPVNFAGVPETVFFFDSLLFISVALILSGIMMMIIRKDLFSQVLGLLTMENGIAAFGLVALHGLPLFLEMGIFFIIITSTIILATLIDNVHKYYTTVDTTNLSNLID